MKKPWHWCYKQIELSGFLANKMFISLIPKQSRLDLPDFLHHVIAGMLSSGKTSFRTTPTGTNLFATYPILVPSF